MPKQRYWMGSTPKCDFCGAVDLKEFVDGKTVHGPWAIICTNYKCKMNMVGLGTGQGQRYVLQDDGQYLKVEG